MAASRSWIPGLGGTRMLLASALLLLLVGLPLQGESPSPATDSKSPSVKECRAHIEKALDQYFETGDQTTTDRNAQTQNLPSDKEEDDEKSSLDASCKNQRADVDNDDEDHDDDESNGNENEDDDDDEDNDNGDGNDDDDDEEESDDINTEKVGNNVTDDDDEDNEDDEDEDDKTVQAAEEDDDDDGDDDDDNTASDIGDDDNDDDDDTEADNDDDDDTEADNDDDEDTEADNDDEDDDDDEENESNNDDTDDKSGDATSASRSANIENRTSESTVDAKLNKVGLDEVSRAEPNDHSVDDDDDDDDDDDEEEVDEDDEDEDGQKKENSDDLKKDEDDDDDDGDDDDEDDDDEEEETEEKTLTDQTSTSPTLQKTKVTSESEKVTGAADSAAIRVAQELSGSGPQAKQPKAQEDEKEPEQAVRKNPAEGIGNKMKEANATFQEADNDDDDDDDNDDDDDDDEDDEDDDDDEDEAIENIYEEVDVEDATSAFRSRDHIDAILALDEVGTGYDQEEDKLANSIYREIKKIHATSIKPMEMLYKFTDSTTRLLGDAEIFNKPMILFLGPWGTGKTTIINYLLGTERTPSALKTGTGITDTDFNVITYGDQRRSISGTELAADWKYASVQKFGQGFLDHFKAVTMPHTLLKRVNLVDTPGILENRKNTDRGYPFNDAFQWFIDRADAIYVVLDPTKVDIGAELSSVLDQLKGRDVRFILNKADTIRRSDLMRVVGQLFWNLSPLMSSTEAPVIYAVSLSSKPFSLSAPSKFLADQENNFMFDLKDIMEKRVENRILYGRRHAVRVRNHAKMVDCYLATYYRQKSIFSNKKNVAQLVTENPSEYHIYEGLGSMTNISRYDLPDPTTYKNFFKLHPLYDFKPLASTCSYFRGCPMEKLDAAIANEFPELFTKYKKAKYVSPQPAKQEGR